MFFASLFLFGVSLIHGVKLQDNVDLKQVHDTLTKLNEGVEALQNHLAKTAGLHVYNVHPLIP